MTVSFFTPRHSPKPPDDAIFASFRRLIAALCVAAALEEEAQGADWDLATADWPDDAAAAWQRVSDLASTLARQPTQSLGDRALVGAAQIVQQAVICDTADGLFALREQMRIGFDICRVTRADGRNSAHAHLLSMAFGLIDAMCLRLTNGAPDCTVEIADMLPPVP